MLSTFESRLLERHLETCASCEAFAADVSEQTLQLRAAPLELAPQLTEIVPAAPRRRRAATFAAAGVAAAAAAVFSIVPSHDQQHATASKSTDRTLLAVVPSQPTANRNF